MTHHTEHRKGQQPLDPGSLRCAIRLLDRVYRAGLRSEWESWLRASRVEHRQASLQQTGHDFQYSSALGADLATLLGANRELCADLAAELLLPNDRAMCLRELKAFVAHRIDGANRRAG